MFCQVSYLCLIALLCFYVLCSNREKLDPNRELQLCVLSSSGLPLDRFT